jgi:hypothetical protein
MRAFLMAEAGSKGTGNRRAYLQTYRDHNRDKYNAAHRRWRSSLYGGPAATRQRKACERNPLASLQSQYSIVNKNFVYCMACWNPVGELGHHDCVKKMGGAEKYREQFGIPASVPLWCEKFAKSKSRVSKKKCAPHVRKYRRENPDALRGKAKPMTWKRTPKGDPISDATLLREWIVEGCAIEKIAAKHQMGISAVMRRLGRILGFPVRRFFHAIHGEPLTKAWIRDLLSRFHLTVAELGAAAGRNRNFIDNLTRPSEQDGMPRLASAKLLGKLDRDVTKMLLTSKGVSQPSVLAAIVPDLREKYISIQKPLAWLLSHCGKDATGFLLNNLDQISKESRREVARGGQFAWRSFLCWLPGLIDFFGENPDWKDKWPTASKLAGAFLAADYVAGSSVVISALFANTKPLPTEAVRPLVLASLEDVSRLPGRDPGVDRLTRRRIKLVGAYTLLGHPPEEVALSVFGGSAASAKSNMRSLIFKHSPAIQVMARVNLSRRRAKEITQDPQAFLAKSTLI